MVWRWLAAVSEPHRREERTRERQLMAKEVHVAASQADAARMIVERDPAHRKPTPEAIRKIARAQVRPSPKAANRPGPKATVNGREKGRLRALLTRAFGKGCSWGG